MFSGSNSQNLMCIDGEDLYVKLYMNMKLYSKALQSKGILNKNKSFAVELHGIVSQRINVTVANARLWILDVSLWAKGL